MVYPPPTGEGGQKPKVVRLVAITSLQISDPLRPESLYTGDVLRWNSNQRQSFMTLMIAKPRSGLPSQACTALYCPVWSLHLSCMVLRLSVLSISPLLPTPPAIFCSSPLLSSPLLSSPLVSSTWHTPRHLISAFATVKPVGCDATRRRSTRAALLLPRAVADGQGVLAEVSGWRVSGESACERIAIDVDVGEDCYRVACEDFDLEWNGMERDGDSVYPTLVLVISIAAPPAGTHARTHVRTQACR